MGGVFTGCFCRLRIWQNEPACILKHGACKVSFVIAERQRNGCHTKATAKGPTAATAPYLYAMRKLSMDELNRKSVTGFKQAVKMPVTVVLDQVRSMNNVGSVFRTADGFLAEQIFLCGYTPRPPHRDIQKTALGATETVLWKGFDNTTAALQQLKNEGYIIVAVEQVAESKPLQHFEWNGTQKLAIVLGSEVEGVSNEALALCDAAVEIPQAGMKHSLNISVAAGIVLWKLFEQYLEVSGE
jgi:23S rRNA (guanosine2251-2'-O)-methyltransferase